MDKTYKPKRVKCAGCGKPIHIDELGVISKEGFYHDNFVCLMDYVKKEVDEK